MDARVLCEIPLEQVRKLRLVGARAEGREIVIVETSAGLRAYSGVCPHLGGPLADACLSGGRIRCPWHRYEFDAVDGRCLTVPGAPWRDLPGRRAERPLPLRLLPLPLRIEGSSVQVLDGRDAG